MLIKDDLLYLDIPGIGAIKIMGDEKIKNKVFKNVVFHHQKKIPEIFSIENPLNREVFENNDKFNQSEYLEFKFFK